MPSGRFIAYYRVSTQRQGLSGLGLEAQRAQVLAYLNGGSWQLVGEFTEVESGKDDANRPELQRALQECRLRNATLIIAKLDRLSRDAHFLLGLAKAGVATVAADMPAANEMTFGIMAIVAQHERKAISERTKQALAARRARGLPLGNPANLREQHRALGSAAGNAAKAARAAARASDLEPVIRDIQSSGRTSLNQIAAELNERGFETSRGGRWSAVQVSRVLARMQPAA